MEIRKGIPVSPGVAISQALVIDTAEFPIVRRFITEAEAPAERARFDQALAAAIAEVKAAYARLHQDMGRDFAAIFEAHMVMLEEPKLAEAVRRLIAERQYTAEYAVTRELNRYVKRWQSVRYLEQRLDDLKDIERRLLRHLVDTRHRDLKALEGDAIIVAADLTPSQTVELDRTHVRGFATDRGSSTSHTAIVARTRGIPAVVGLKTITADVSQGDVLIIDGTRGTVIINPDEDTLAKYRRRGEEYRSLEAALEKLHDLPAETLDGHRVALLGNIEFPEEVETCLRNGADGIGLYRTEFLYLGADHEPTEADHYEAYQRVVRALEGRPITIRTLDLGADKLAFAGEEDAGRNPALGARSIRLCLANPDLFRPQLRAILRVSALGRVRVMFPLISSLSELRHAKALVREVVEDLIREGLPFDRGLKIGMMIEVPAAAVAPDLFAREADFFSIGTNDLVQYTLAVDRTNEQVAWLFSPAHPAVLRLIKNVVDAGERHGIDVSLCGEMGGQAVYTILLLGMGLRTFSIAPLAIPDVKRIIRSVTMAEAREVVARVMAFDDSDDAVAYLVERTKSAVPELSL
jgi:phosphotransferase system enzyme I (PtsI)